MNGIIDRDFVVQVIIALAVCCGSWMMFVQPKVEELRRIEQSTAEIMTDPDAVGQDALRAVADRMDRSREQAGEVRDLSALAEDSSRLYGRVRSLAREHSVNVLTLQPGNQAKQDESDVIRATIDLTAEGRYENIAQFINAIDKVTGFVRSESLTITPGMNEHGELLVSVRYSFQALGFRLPDAVKGIERVAHVE